MNLTRSNLTCDDGDGSVVTIKEVKATKKSVIRVNNPFGKLK